MGDRTFSEFFLTSDEQEIVDFFFAVEPEEPQRDNFFLELEIIAESIDQARAPLPGLFSNILRLVPFLATLVTVVQFALERADILVQRLLNQEEISA